MGIGRNIRQAMEAAGKTPVDIARHLEITDAAVSFWFANDSGPKASRLAKLASFLGTTVEALLTGQAPSSAAQQEPRDISPFVPLRPADTPPPPLVRWRSGVATDGRAGAWMLTSDKDGVAERPEFLRYAEKAFATKVIDGSNEPAYRPRDTILIDAGAAALPGDDCIFTDETKVHAGSPAMLGQLVRSTPRLWIIRQYARKAELELPRAEWPNAWPVVGRYNRR